MKLKRWIALSFIAAFFGVVAYSGIDRGMEVWERRTRVLEQEQVHRPEAKRPAPVVVSTSSSAGSVSSSTSSAPEQKKVASVNWDVPFTSQAPHGEWDEVHKEACEEASILMVLRYFQNRSITGPDDAEAGLQEILAENEEFGFGIDTTAAEVAQVLRSLSSSLSVKLMTDPTEDDLKNALVGGALIIVPAQGQYLGNPYFRVPGPRYHMLVLRGFTDDGYVITNDPGTKRGQEFVYTWDVLMNAIHDWNGGEVETGEKVVVVVRQ